MTESLVTDQQQRERAHAGMRARHEANARLPIEEKVRQLLQMQRELLPIIAARRPLKWHEKPWDIEP